jgi:hypothetical protein
MATVAAAAAGDAAQSPAAAAGAAAASQASSRSSSDVVVFDAGVFNRTIRGVVFDMDGTLTVPVIDFQYMRQVRGQLS